MSELNIIADIATSTDLKTFALGFYMALSLRQGRIAQILDLMLPMTEGEAQGGQQARQRSQQDREQAMDSARPETKTSGGKQ